MRDDDREGLKHILNEQIMIIHFSLKNVLIAYFTFIQTNIHI